VRANVQLDVATWCPQVISISGDDGESEPAAFAKSLLSGVLYVVDRNFVNFDFLRALREKHNDFVLRSKSNLSVQTLHKLELTPSDVEAGVVEDSIVTLSGRGAPPGRFRLVIIHAVDRKGKLQIIRLLSNLTDTAIGAHVIGAIYRQRWQIELFFKWFKTFARLDHLLSTSVNGITFQLYVAVIGVLMMYVQSGRRVSIYTLGALSRLARGECTLQQAMEVIAHRERERDLNRLRQARKRAMKKLV
jgi:hypothetical protein